MVPTIEELELFTESELHDKLLEARAAGDTAVPASTATSMSLATSQLHTLATASSKQAAGSMRGKDESNEPRRELATMLYHLLVDQKSKADAASAVQAQVEEEGRNSNLLTLSCVTLLAICCNPSMMAYRSTIESRQVTGYTLPII